MRRVFALVLCLVHGTGTASGQQDSPMAGCEVRGVVESASGSGMAPESAVVFVCDAKTGWPVLRDDAKTNEEHLDWNSWVHAVTDDHGRFVIPKLSAGTYRFVAQSWSGTQGLPEFQGETSSSVFVHGVASGVVVPDPNQPDGPVAITIRPLGMETVRITADPQEASAFLILSTGKTIGDPVLGIAGWGAEFLNSAFMITHLSSPTLEIFGLPKGVEITASAFYYDNVPGVGGVSWNSGEQREVTFRVYSGWSNAHDQPPPRLEKLTAYLKTHRGVFHQLVSSEDREQLRQTLVKMGADAAWKSVGGPNRQVDVPEIGPTALVDLFAAHSYSELQRHHEALRQRRQVPRAQRR